MRGLDEALAVQLKDALRCALRGDVVFTHFLDPTARQALNAAAAREGVCVAHFGGYEDSERCVSAAFPDWMPPPETWPVRALRVAWNGKYDRVEHRDLLGALLAQGVNRDALGDILLEADCALVFVSEKVASALCLLDRAGRAPVRVTLAAPDEVPAPRPGELRTRTLASLRLDALLGAALDLSREKAKALITSGLVKQNHLVVLAPDARVAEGDLFSIRGHGRVRLAELGGQSKKERWFVQLERWG